MEILLSTSDDSLAQQVIESLAGQGHVVQRWTPDQPVPRSVSLAIIDGLDGVVESHEAPCDILALVDEQEVRLFAECPREITDFIFKPVRASELCARVSLIAARPSFRERIKQALLSLAVETAGDIIEITTPDVTYEYVNPAYEKILGYAPAEAIGKTPKQLVGSNQHSPEFFRQIDETLARGETWNGVMIAKAKDGRLVHLDSTISTVTSAKGQITHHLAVKRDITERLSRQEALIEANRALSQARDAAVAASRAKSGFLANMSHELRTPLNAIIGYSEMLLEDFQEDEQVAKDLMRIRTAGTHLLSLINDVLDISKIEAEKVELSPEWIQLPELVEQVAATVQPMADKNGNRFTIELAGVGRLYADRTRLRQVLLNLLSNACKFTKRGEVELGARAFEREGADWVELVVRDTGIGISDAQKSKLFQPFVQADSSTTREYGGTGLGLVICKRLVEMMGGEIELESALGVGTTLTVRLPLDASAREQRGPSLAMDVEPRPPEPSGPAPTVLLIDDDPAVRDLFVRQLSKRGFRPRVAATGQEGLAYAARLKPHAIVLDVKMPGLTGWDVLSALKLSDATARIPVIMLTVMQQREIGQALGAVDYLIKPFDAATLIATLRRHTGLVGTRVLVVEDDEPTRELVRRTLESDGNLVTEAENGQIALDCLRELEPDIVVLDLMMPVMDGFTFLHHLRRDPRFERLPVVVATARELADDERKELERLVQRVIEKNAYSRHDLLDAISHEIHRVIVPQLEA